MKSAGQGERFILTEERVRRPWFRGAGADLFCRKLDELRGSIENEADRGPVLVLEEAPVDFLARFFAALLAGRAVAVGNAKWGAEELRQARRILAEEEGIRAGEVLIPTGGSGGRLRFARHSWESLAASAEGFCDFFGGRPVRSVCVLPLFHVSGLMQVVRAVVTDGECACVGWEGLLPGEVPEANGRFLSVVPTQLRRLLGMEALHPWLRELEAILVGGASSSVKLLEAAAELELPVVLSYGATETAAMVTAQKRGDFLAGDRTCGWVLPHGKVFIRGAGGEALAAEKEGRICVGGPSLFGGYLPGERRTGTEWISGDLGFIDGSGRLVVTGREDRMVITGGENVSPEEVENVLLASGLVEDVRVFGVSDDEWGQALAAAYVARETVAVEVLRAAVKAKLAGFKVPKIWMAVEEIPRSAHGKIDRRRLEAMVGNGGSSRFSM